MMAGPEAWNARGEYGGLGYAAGENVETMPESAHHRRVADVLEGGLVDTQKVKLETARRMVRGVCEDRGLMMSTDVDGNVSVRSRPFSQVYGVMSREGDLFYGGAPMDPTAWVKAVGRAVTVHHQGLATVLARQGICEAHEGYVSFGGSPPLTIGYTDPRFGDRLREATHQSLPDDLVAHRLADLVVVDGRTDRLYTSLCGLREAIEGRGLTQSWDKGNGKPERLLLHAGDQLVAQWQGGEILLHNPKALSRVVTCEELAQALPGVVEPPAPSNRIDPKLLACELVACGVGTLSPGVGDVWCLGNCRLIQDDSFLALVRGAIEVELPGDIAALRIYLLCREALAQNGHRLLPPNPVLESLVWFRDAVRGHGLEQWAIGGGPIAAKSATHSIATWYEDGSLIVHKRGETHWPRDPVGYGIEIGRAVASWSEADMAAKVSPVLAFVARLVGHAPDAFELREEGKMLAAVASGNVVNITTEEDVDWLRRHMRSDVGVICDPLLVALVDACADGRESVAAELGTVRKLVDEYGLLVAKNGTLLTLSLAGVALAALNLDSLTLGVRTLEGTLNYRSVPHGAFADALVQTMIERRLLVTPSPSPSPQFAKTTPQLQESITMANTKSIYAILADDEEIGHRVSYHAGLDALRLDGRVVYEDEFFYSSENGRISAHPDGRDDREVAAWILMQMRNELGLGSDLAGTVQSATVTQAKTLAKSVGGALAHGAAVEVVGRGNVKLRSMFLPAMQDKLPAMVQGAPAEGLALLLGPLLLRALLEYGPDLGIPIPEKLRIAGVGVTQLAFEHAGGQAAGVAVDQLVGLWDLVSVLYGDAIDNPAVRAQLPQDVQVELERLDSRVKAVAK